MRRLMAVGFLALAGCGSWQRVGGDTTPPPEEQAIAQMTDLPSIYRSLGRLAAGAPLPFIGSVGVLAGPADSSFALVALSFSNKDFSFNKSGTDFVARYRVEIVAQRQGTSAVTLTKDETVRVRTYQETQRSDESLLFQQTLRLAPGTYSLSVTLHDLASPRSSSSQATVTVPDYAPGTVSAPFFVYQVKGRPSPAVAPSAILNPRGTVAYGGDSLLAYVEGYGMTAPRAVPFELRDERDSVVLSSAIQFAGGTPLEAHAILIRSDSVPLGVLRLVLDPGPNQRWTGLLVSLSPAWLVTNYDDMIDLLRYFGTESQLAALKKATPAERPALWAQFWHDTDPNPDTPQNEALTEYFIRLAQANRLFTNEGVAGWRTDRGEVYITAGPPDEIYDSTVTGQDQLIRWSYIVERLTLYFQDPSGFGRFNLTSSSRSQFENWLASYRRRTSK
jgi:GWxTD domain-containing protein